MSSSKNQFMKKVSFTALATAFAFPAFAADANFKIYGNLDSGVEMVTNAKVNATTNATVVRVPSTTGTFPSNLGFDMSKDVGGVKAIAKAEMGYYMDAGNSGQGGRLFGRQLYVGIDYGAGSITVGRQNNMMYWGTMAGDPLGPNIYGLGSIDPYIPNARYDNSVAWRGKFDALSAGVAYSFGNNSKASAGAIPLAGDCAGETAGDAQACHALSAMVQYDASNFGIAAAYDRQHGGTGAQYDFYNGYVVPPAPVSGFAFGSSNDTDTRTTLNGYYKVDALKIGAGILQRKVSIAAASPKQSTTWLEAAYTMDKWQYMAGIFHVSATGQVGSGPAYTALNDTKANLLVLRAVYNFDDQLSSYVTIGNMGNDSNSGYGVSGGGSGTAPNAGQKQTGTMIGMRYHF